MKKTIDETSFNRNKDTLLANGKEIKLNMSNIFRPHDSTNENNSNIKKKPRQTQTPSQTNLFEPKSRYVRKQVPNVTNNLLTTKNIAFSNDKLNDSFWSYTDSVLNLNDNDKKFNSPSTNLRTNKIKFQDVSQLASTLKFDQTTESTEQLNTNSIMRWSKQLGPSSSNQATPRVTSFSNEKLNVEESFELSKNKSLMELPFKTNILNKNSKTDKLESKTTLQPSVPINRLMDIIERENTAFSIKLSYDNPFSNRKDALTPHTYLDLDIDPQLKLARENTIKNMRDVFNFEDELSRARKLRNNATSPELYQSLQKPSEINIYSELNLEEMFSNKQTNTNGASSKPANNYTSVKNKYTNKPSILKPDSKLSQNSNNYVKDKKANTPGYQSIDFETSQIFNTKEDDFLNPNLVESKNDKNFHNSDIYSHNILVQSSNSVFDQIENKPKSSVDHKNYQKNIDLSILDGLISSMKYKETLKETPIPKKNQSPKQQRKPKTNTKKPSLKEFKYCILTDLKIGEGEFSETFQGYRYDLGPPLKIAAKRLKISKEKDEQNVQNLLSEISVLSQLGRYNYVIEFLGVFHYNSTMFLIFEYCEKGDLKRVLDVSRKNGRRDLHLNNLCKLRIAYEIASGMEYISSLDIVHKDLAARNILLDKDYTCKIADFGCCKAEFLTKMPIRWMAPESLNKLLFTTASDVWSFGVLLWEIYTYGITPYPGMTDDEVIGRINQWYRLYKPQDCPNEVYAIMLSCWKDYHKARPRFFNLKNKFRDLYKLTSEAQQQNLNTNTNV